MTPSFILASGSPRRRELLSEIGITFTVIKPDIAEQRTAGEPPLEYVARLSREKAAAVADMIARRDDAAGAPTVILAADTTVILAAEPLGIQNGDILEKPASEAEARAMLRRLRGKPHTVATALTLLRIAPDGTRQADTRVTQSSVYMRDYTDDEIETYIATREPFDKAGAYAIQDTTGFRPAARYEGSYTNIMGLPIETLRDMLSG
ncbi:MAG: Maf family protein [bacterium]|nr:Maf family protein [bacterium]